MLTGEVDWRTLNWPDFVRAVEAYRDHLKAVLPDLPRGCSTLARINLHDAELLTAAIDKSILSLFVRTAHPQAMNASGACDRCALRRKPAGNTEF